MSRFIKRRWDNDKTFCEGGECPLKYDCKRYKENIKKKKEDHFMVVPYNFSKKKCEFFIELDGEES